MPLMNLYRVSDLLVRRREAIETALFSRINTLFSLPATVTLHDLTNTYFEGEMAGNAKARRGHSTVLRPIALRRKLKAQCINESWTSLREVFSTQQRVTATFKQRDGRTLHVRKTTVAEPKLQRLYAALNLTADPVGVRKLLN